jgi:O-acetyl-ADP-ribose deacetylase (regulator of RNase III)
MKFELNDILEVQGEYLISSGNTLLNMSGGVNGALMEKYGMALQIELHDELKSMKLKYVNPGYCYKFKQKIGSYKDVIYTVGIDAWYNSSTELVVKAITDSIKLLNPEPSETVILPAIGTGYGNLDKVKFGYALAQVETKINCNCIIVERNEIGMDEIIHGYKNAPNKRMHRTS